MSLYVDRAVRSGSSSLVALAEQTSEHVAGRDDEIPVEDIPVSDRNILSWQEVLHRESWRRDRW
jgi:hypothetical protein